MILRRITEHVKAQNWTAVALDFVIVVVGVFIGIQVSNWRADRLDEERELAILASIQVEMRTYSDELERAIVFAKNKQSSARVLLRSAAQDQAPSDNIDALIADLTWWQTATSSRNVLYSLLSDANITLIHDQTLKADLLTWPNRMNLFEEAQRMDQNRFEQLVLPFLIKKAFVPQIGNSLRPFEGSFNEAAIFHSVEFPPEHHVDHLILLKDPEFLGIIVAVDWDQSEIVAVAERTQADIEETISALATKLD